MSLGNMDYIIKVTRELGVEMPHIILATSGKHECSEYCPQTDELIYTKLGADGCFQLAHELRHKWQWVKHYEEYFENYQEMDKMDLKTYGEQKAEVDANAFSVVMGMKYLNTFPVLPQYPKSERKKIFKRAKLIAKEYGLNKIDWKQIYQFIGI